jgi:hypothetical protein
MNYPNLEEFFGEGHWARILAEPAIREIIYNTFCEKYTVVNPNEDDIVHQILKEVDRVTPKTSLNEYKSLCLDDKALLLIKACGAWIGSFDLSLDHGLSPYIQHFKSIGIKVRLESMDKTLTKEDIDEVSAKIIQATKNETGAVLREEIKK